MDQLGQKFDDFLRKSGLSLAFKKEIQRDVVTRSFTWGVAELGLGVSRLQSKTDGGIAGKLLTVFAPIFYNGNIGRTLPVNVA